MKVAFVVEPQFASLHIGVRNYILALGHLLESHCSVDYITQHNQLNAPKRWARFWIQNSLQRVQGAITEDVVFSGSPSQVLASYFDYLGLKKVRETSDDDKKTDDDDHDSSLFVRSDLGTHFDFQQYDTVFLTNPWLVNFTHRLTNKRQIGLVLDIVPNLYVFTKKAKPFGFANQHRIGFEYFRDQCDATLAISTKTATDLQKYFHFRESQVVALPPMIPAAYSSYRFKNQERKYQLILASPFDLRKGLTRMPTLIKGAQRKIQSIAIYGNMRCDERELATFFRDLPKHLQVTWYLQATATSVQNLFEQSQVLLFPSSEEGLGIPVIEAQLCGTRVVTSNIDPLNGLLLKGNALLTGNDAEDIAILEKAIDQPLTTPSELAQTAFERYSTHTTKKSVLPHFGLTSGE